MKSPLTEKLASAYEDVMTLVELGMDSPEESEATFEEAKLEYNALMDEIDALEAAGRVFVLRPAQPIGIGRFEGDTEKLLDLYNRGRRGDARRPAACGLPGAMSLLYKV